MKDSMWNPMYCLLGGGVHEKNIRRIFQLFSKYTHVQSCNEFFFFFFFLDMFFVERYYSSLWNSFIILKKNHKKYDLIFEIASNNYSCWSDNTPWNKHHNSMQNSSCGHFNITFWRTREEIDFYCAYECYTQFNR